MGKRASSPVSIARALGRAASRCRFTAPVAHVYNPLDYAFGAHSDYLDRYCLPEANVLLLGMNPDPWGMVQTGVPFGEVTLVRDWLGIDSGVRKPKRENPKRPVAGFDCGRNEVSRREHMGCLRGGVH